MTLNQTKTPVSFEIRNIFPLRFIAFPKVQKRLSIFGNAYCPNHVGNGSKLTIFSSPEREHIRILARSLNSPQVPSTFPQLPQVISASCPHTARTAIEAPPHAGHMNCTVIATPRRSRLFTEGKQGMADQVNRPNDAPLFFRSTVAESPHAADDAAEWLSK